MEKCWNIYDEELGKVLIPGCWSVVISGDMRTCTCRAVQSFTQFEKQAFNTTIKKKNEQITALEKEDAQLYRIIKKLTKK